MSSLKTKEKKKTVTTKNVTLDSKYTNKVKYFRDSQKSVKDKKKLLQDYKKDYWKTNLVDEKMKFFINNERLIRRFFRLNILNHSLDEIDSSEAWRLE